MTNRLTRYFFTVLPALLLVACTNQPTAQKTQGGSLPASALEPESTSPLTPSRGTESIFDVTPLPETPSVSHGSPALPLMSDSFPKPPVLEPQVAFWRKVYGVWSRSQVAIHDDRHLSWVYEVMELPGEITESYTPGQKERVGERLDYWKSRLHELEQKLAANSSLSGDDQRLASLMGQSTDIGTAVRGASERVHAQRGLRERFKRGLEISGRYDRYFRDIFRKAGLPEDLAYLPHVESSFQSHSRSSAGAVGIWQFTRAAAKAFFVHVHGSIDERLDPIASAHGAARYLSHAYDQLGSWPLALTSYNHGIGGMQRAKDHFGHDFMRIVREYDHPQFGFASRNYYAEFLAARDVARQPERFFPEGVYYDKPLDWDRVALTRGAPVSRSSRYYGTHPWQLTALNNVRRGAPNANREAKSARTAIRRTSGTVHHITQRQEVSRLAKGKVEGRHASRRIQIYQQNYATVDPHPRNGRIGSKYKVAQVQVVSRR